MSNLLFRVALFAERHYRAVLISTLLLVVLSLFLVSRLHFDPDILSLMPQKNPAVETFKQTLEEFGGLDLLLVVVRVPEGQVLDPYQQFVDELGTSLAQDPHVDYVDYRIGDPAQLLRTFFPNAFFYLEPEEREELVSRLTPEGVAERVAELRRRLTTPQALALKELLLLDPLGLSEVLLGRLEAGRGAMGVDWSSGYYLSKDRRLFLLLARPKGAAQDIPFGKTLITDIEKRVADVQASWASRSSELGETPPPLPEVALGGSYVTAVADADLIKRDVIYNAFSSVFVVLVLFYFAFRRPGLLIYALMPLGASLLFTFALFSLWTDVLSSATSGCAAIMVGLGIDFVIVSYGRYAEERRRGASDNEALRQMTSSCGLAVVTGGITTAATFFSFTFTEFQGLRQMGLITGTGILLTVVCVLLLLPALLAWSHARQRRLEKEAPIYIHGFKADSLLRLSARRPALTLTIGVVLTLASAAALPFLKFESSIANLRPDGNRGIEIQREVSEHFGTNFRYMMLLVHGPSLDETLDLAATASDMAKQLVVQTGEIQRVDSINSLLPAPKKQKDVLAWLDNERAGRLDFPRLKALFESELKSQGLRAEPFAEGIDLFGQAVAANRPIAIADLAHVPGAERLLKRYLRQEGTGYKSVVYLYPEGDRWKSDPPPGAEVLANRLGSAVELTGVNVLSRSLRKQVWFDAIFASLLGFVLVSVLLLIDYRAVRPAFLSMAQLVVGILWMLATMAILGLNINFMNIFVSTMILGIGVDYGVHMLHRYRELQAEDDETVINGLAETGTSVAMAALTTVVGFGSLALSHYPGLRSMGYAAILGAMMTAIASITLLPAYLMMVRKHLEKT